MLAEDHLGERLRAALHREMAAINPSEDLLERLRAQAAQPDAPPAGRPRRAHWPGGGAVVATLGAVVAVGVAVLAIVLVGHGRSTAPPGTPGARSSDLRMLDGDGLGTVTFGRSPAAVVAGLRPMLGAPLTVTRAAPTGLVHSICEFDGQIEWRRSIASTEGRSIFDDLRVYFRHSRFVGYSYNEDWIPYGPQPALPPDHRALLSTSRGLTLNQSATRARELYGTAFAQGTEPQRDPPVAKLPRLPAWRARTPSGQLFGGLSTRPPVTIGSINAGAVPNTPCHR